MLISGKGQMQNYTAYEETPWADCRDMIEKITIDNGVTNVGSYAFNDCTELYSVSLAKTCTRIGSHAFSGCKRLYTMVLPQQLTMLDSYAFDGCTRLDYVELPDSLTRIDGWAFRDTALESVTVPKNVASIGNDAFSGCSKLKTITILNPECKIADSEHTIPEVTVIAGLSGSTAQQDAENYKREFVRLDTETTVSTQTTVTTTVTTVTTARTSETTRSESTAKTDSAKETTVTTTTTVTVKTVTTTTPAPTDTQKSSVTTTSTTISTQTTAKTTAPVHTETTASVPASDTSGTTDTTASETAAPTVPGTTDTHTTAQSTSSERTSGTSGTTASSSTSGTSGTSATSGTSTGTTDTVPTDTQTGTMPTEAPTTSQKTDTTPAVTVTTETTQKTTASSESTGETTADTTKSTETTTTSASEKQETTTVTTISTAQSVQSGSSSDSTAKTTTTILSESTESVPTETTVSTSETTVKTETETEPVSATDDTADTNDTAETTETTTETTRPTETELTETDTTDSEITDTETTESVTVTQDTATEPESTEPQETTTVTVADAAFVFTLAEQFNCHSQETRTFAEIGLSPYCKLLVRGGIYAMNEDGQYLDADGNVTEEAVMLEAWEYDVLDWFTINADMDSPQKIWNQETGAHAHAYRISLSATMADFRSREENGELPEGVTDMLFRSGDTISFDIPVYIGIPGDYNLDDQIRADDAQRALRSYVDSALIGSEFKLLAAADNPDEPYRTSLVQYLVGAVNDDGKLDAADAQLILSYYIEHLAGHTDRTFADVRQPEVTLSNSKLMLNTEGDSRTYQLTLYYGGEDTPVWSSSDPAIATVSDDGLVTAKTDGIALITVRTARGIAYCQVTVETAYEKTWSDYSEWTTEKPEASDEVEVITENRESQVLVGYNMESYCTVALDPWRRQFRDYSVNGNYEEYGLSPAYGEHHNTWTFTADEVKAARIIHPGEQQGGPQNGTNVSEKDGYCMYFAEADYVFFIASENYETVTTTYYAERHLVDTPVIYDN